MTQLYECMFVLDNDAVRAGWASAKGTVTAAVEKHGGKVLSARHWAERRLAYPIRHRNRATYLLAFCEMPTSAVDPLSRELNISDNVLRYLFLSAGEVPAKELELSAAELDKEYTIAPPPDDDAVEEVAAVAEEEPGADAPAKEAADKEASDEKDGKPEKAAEATTPEATTPEATKPEATKAEATEAEATPEPTATKED